MFSEAYNGEIRKYFDNQMVLLKSRVAELKEKETKAAEKTGTKAEETKAEEKTGTKAEETKAEEKTGTKAEETKAAEKTGVKAEEAKAAETAGNLYHVSRMLLERKIEEISSRLEQCTQDEAEALKFLYSAMPMSDLLNYPVTVYLAYAKHAVFLWNEGAFAGKVPEKLFANYVLHHRVHNEDIADTRKFFYNRLRERTAGKSMYEAAVETNYWCAEKATYQTTFMRTQNPLTMYGTAAGRCGEEAPFVVTALRSIGIPAREVASPWWVHCDDNHACVEAWCDGEWHFLGGCEPEKILDKGWFEGPASRAMMIESRWFGKDSPEEQVVGRPDMAASVNHLGLYAKTAELVVKVIDEAGNPVPGARVDFAVLNYARFNSVAFLYTGKEENSPDYGKVRIETGYGDFLVCAYADGCYGETHVSLEGITEQKNLYGEKADETEKSGCIVALEQEENGGKESQSDKPEYNVLITESECTGIPEMETPQAGLRAECTVILRKEIPELNQWRDMDFHAPKGVLQDERMTEEEAAAEKAALEKAAGSRQRRIEAFYRKEDAERVLMRFTEEDRSVVDEILHQARGNMGEIVRFLEWDFTAQVPELERRYGQEHWKVKALKTLHPNDLWDIRAEVLAECSVCASPYAGEFSQEVFFADLLNPCAMFEFPRACRKVLQGMFSEAEKEEIREEPKCLLEKLDSLLISMPEQEYANLITGPVGCLTGGIGNEISRAVLCIQIYRALGIPARMRPMDKNLEYYMDGRFVPLNAKKAGHQGVLILESGETLKLEDWKHYSLSRFENGRFMPLFIRPERKKPESAAEQEKESESGMERRAEQGTESEVMRESNEAADEKAERRLELESGRYRLVTTNRLPNGNQFVKIQDFDLPEGEEKRIALQICEIFEEALLSRTQVEDFALHTAEGKEVMLSALSEGKRALVLWLELTREPTEHVLNEICEKHELFQKLTSPIYFVLRKGENYVQDQTLLKTRGFLPWAEILFHDFGEPYANLSRQVGRNPGKLPLAAIMENGKNCIFSDSGYNVGMADMLLRILE